MCVCVCVWGGVLVYSGEGVRVGGAVVVISLSIIMRPILCSLNTSSFKLRKVSVQIPCSPIW